MIQPYFASLAEVLSGRFSFIGHCEKISCRFEKNLIYICPTLPEMQNKIKVVDSDRAAAEGLFPVWNSPIICDSIRVAGQGKGT
jgi:hypothetical protein